MSEENISRRTNAAAYGSNRPVPTVQRYEKEQEQRRAGGAHATSDEAAKEQTGADQEDIDEAETYLHLGENTEQTEPIAPGLSKDDSASGRKSDQQSNQKSQGGSKPDQQGTEKGKSAGKGSSGNGEANDADQSQSQAVTDGVTDPKEKRKLLQHLKRDHQEREVTDPVTHLPVTIHDVAAEELEHVPENLAPATSSGSHSKRTEREERERQLKSETRKGGKAHADLEKLFPSPSFESARKETISIYRFAFTTTVALMLAGSWLMVKVTGAVRSGLSSDDHSKDASSILSFSISGVLLLIGLGAWWAASILFASRWMEKKISEQWKDAVWEAESQRTKDVAESHQPESTEWLNSILSSVWQLINPDLFTSMADTLEDVMQASLPRMVRMISVEDLGQGNEAIRILGIRWLPAGAAATSVSVDGEFETSQKDSKNDGSDKGQKVQSDRSVPGEGELQEKPDNGKSDNQEDGEDVAEGMEAEEGDFINLEVAFSYRAKPGGKTFKGKSKNAHLYLGFYLPGGIKFPVWVELRGIAGTMRLRLQLTPDPPFFALCTLTFLGQPKADLSCVPLTKRGLNIMDLPLISGFVQSSMDAALAEYVAPKSLTLDLKDMIVGDDIKKDTNGRGILMVKIKKAYGFKEGDSGMLGFKKGSSDAYVTIGWSKFGKPVWSTRIVLDDMKPIWDETAFVIVGPEEINADECLKIQLWDSDRTSADDNLGQIEADLKDLMQTPQTKAKMHDRCDRLKGLSGDEPMPGNLEWSVGYFGKIRLLPEQYSQQTVDKSIKSRDQLKEKVSEDAQQKLREATVKDESEEMGQQKSQDMHEKEVAMIASAPPSGEYPSGIFSIQIHQIVGLEVEQSQRSQAPEDSADEQDGDDLPSSYCTVIINQRPVYRTRTKPKNANPFFNAGTERFVRDWRTTQIIVSVRDSRVHEDDPLLGIVSIPQRHTFKDGAQIDGNFPLAGGIGYGRVRISMVFRSVQLKAPLELLGWEYGTLIFPSKIEHKGLPEEYTSLRLKLSTTVGKSKMVPSEGAWVGKKDRSVRVAVQKRYSSCLSIEFRKNQLGKDKTAAFAILWLHEIPDEEDCNVEMSVWKGDDALKRARTNCDPEPGEKIGTLHVPLRFERGLSRYHNKLIQKDNNLQDVSEALECAEEIGAADPDGNDDSDQSGSKSSDNDSDTDKSSDDEEASLQNDGKRGPIDQIRDYKEHKSELHRRHRGLMQWKGPRTAKWLRTKVEHGKDHIAGNFQHRGRSPGIETEV
ncbi:MAG: hypothetical protein M4579_000850 [Chaenotheca gracillima]|nr:MAG: hypothetical protein M4579_000850 [Chaenotheca gracillima]